MRKWFLNFEDALLKRKINVNSLLASLKTITYSKDCPIRQKTQQSFCSGFPFGGYLKPGTNFLKSISDWAFRISTDGIFIEASKNLIFSTPGQP
jgi:hypothetical protein